MDVKSAVALSIIRLLGLMNLRVARQLGRFIGWLMRATKSRMFKVTQKNIELCFPDMPADEQQALVKASLAETSKAIAETGIAWGGTDEAFIRNQNLILKVRNEHLILDAIKKDKGVLLLALHFGNWEWFSGGVPKYLDNAMALYKMAKMPGLEKAMLDARAISGVKLVSGNREGVETFVEHYAQHQSCIIVPDQEPSEKSGVWAKFFGIEALTPKFIHNLIMKNPEGTALNTYMKRIEGGFEMVFEAVEPEIYSEDLVTSAQAMNKGFEKCIADDLSQYQWEYKRFKRNAQGYYEGL